jgi:hypothetical protein
MSGIMQMMLGAPVAPAVFTATQSTSLNNANLRSLAIGAGWDEVRALSFVINSGVIISSNDRTLPALTISGSFPNGVTLVNNGVIVGDGGDGGNGGSDTATNGVNGTAGGDAIVILSAVSINNLGTIAGAGGGGGGGGLALSGGPDDSLVQFFGGCGGGGGASGSFSSNGGGPGTGTFIGNSGASGSYNSAGLGGTKASHASGGNGGSWGAAGSNGGAGSYTAGSGGAGGRSINGNSFVTWVAFGTRLGTII